MATKAIVGIDEDTWNKFKAQATRKGMNMSEYFRIVVNEAEKRDTRKWWKELLELVEKRPSYLTEADVRRMKGFRENFRMRSFQ